MICWIYLKIIQGEEAVGKVIGQGLANYGPEGKSGPPPDL